jgi:ryanodine receptor 2
VNAATLTLLRGERRQAERIARRILKQYDKRRAILAPGNSIRYAGFWDRATEAEALLIAGQLDDSRMAYRNAIAVYADRRGMIDSSLRQLDLLLPALQVGDTARAWVDCAPTARSDSQEENLAKEYRPLPIDTSHIELDTPLIELIELLAENNHDLWARMRLAEGWRYGAERNGEAKTTPCLVPYAALPESEKEYDREMAREALRTMLALGFRIER